MMPTDAKTVAKTYFQAWKAEDFETLRSILADEVTFSGPMGTADGADECLRGLQGMAKDMDDIEIHVVVADGSDVITWYDLHMRGVVPLPTANWSHVEDGKITSIHATFDPRPMTAGAGN
jgi:limonene-1,2-epoxide hydrolase